MKTTHILKCLLLSIPFNAVAHPGHADGVIDTVIAGSWSVQLWSLSLLLTLGVILTVIGIYRRRNSARVDD